MGYLVTALACGDFLSVVDFQADFLAQMEGVVGVVARDGDGFAVDEPVERQRGLGSRDGQV